MPPVLRLIFNPPTSGAEDKVTQAYIMENIITTATASANTAAISRRTTIFIETCSILLSDRKAFGALLTLKLSSFTDRSLLIEIYASEVQALRDLLFEVS